MRGKMYVMLLGLSCMQSLSFPQQLSRVPISSSSLDREAEPYIPTLTRPRTAGSPGSHPIQGHRSYLPDPDVLDRVSLTLNLSPELLMRHLDHHTHLTYSPRGGKLVGLEMPGIWSASERTELRISVNQASHLTVMVGPRQVSSFGEMA